MRRPARLVSWGLFGLGAALAAGSLLKVGNPGWLGPGLTLIGLSMLADVLLPGGSELDDVQTVTLRRIGIAEPQRAHRLASLTLGALFAIGGAVVALV